MTDLEKMELAIRRVASNMKSRASYNIDIVDMLEKLASEMSRPRNSATVCEHGTPPGSNCCARSENWPG